MTDFRTSYPIDFELYDKDTQNVLYIEDTSDQQLTLKITNASTQTIELADPNGFTLSSSDYHFALRFRPGTLSPASLGEDVNSPEIQLADGTADDWEMLLSPAEPSGMDVIYIKSKTTNLSIAPDTSQPIVFDYVGADAGQGARGTRVELRYTNMSYSDGGETITGNREIHMSVINHRGKQNIPLHVGFVGDNGVLNDGTTQNTLKLRFFNILVYDSTNPHTSELRFLHNDNTTLRSKFILSFDVGIEEEEEWALGDSDGIAGITITKPDGWDIIEPVQGESPEWILYPDTQDQVLYGRYAPDSDPDPNASAFLPDYFDLLIEDIVSSFPTGHTYLHIQYENIPGYWDGQLKVAIEKRPLVYSSGNVGIGTREPGEKLQVAGNIYIDNNEHQALTIRTPDDNIDQAIVFRNSANSYNWSLGRTGDSSADFKIAGGANLNPANLNEYIRITNSGFVGIGTTNPQTELDVNGTISSGTISSGTVDCDNLIVNNESRLYGNLLISDSGGAINYPLTIRKDTSGNPVLAYFGSANNNGADAGITIKGSRDNSTVTTSYIDLDIEDSNESSPLFTMARIGAGKQGAGINGQLRFSINNNGTLNEAMRIDQSGNVGIGTTTPDATLDVAGPIKYSGGADSTLFYALTNESGTPAGGSDGFRIRHEEDYFGTFDDAFIFEKTDV